MFWDNVSPVYDFFENVYNNKVYNNLGKFVAEEISFGDDVLECACGTGAITEYIAGKCRKLIAVDISKGMLKQAKRKCRNYSNVKFGYANIMSLKCKDNRFDKVVAGNVIHLLDDPESAVGELLRVCRHGGKVIIPTYINNEGTKQRKAVMFLEKLGVEFKHEFNIDTYKKFFFDAGYTNTVFHIVEGKMPCAVAVITKK